MTLDVAFNIGEGQLIAIYGSSGAGKTTILRLISGLSMAEKLYTEVGGQIWSDSSKKIFLQPQERSIGFVFQDLALFPNLTLRENIEYALPKKENKNVVDELIEALELTALQRTKPLHLSGGQKQRVALARAIARKPRLLLLDEPLSALDTKMRSRLQEFILKVHREFNFTTILVSHHLPEVYKMADQVFCLEKGKIEKCGPPDKIFSVQKVDGKMNIPGEILSIQKSDSVYIISILSDGNIIEVVATDKEIENLNQRILVK